MTRALLCGLFGAGIQRSLAPALQEEEARHHGLALHYQLIDLDLVRGGAGALPMLVDAARAMQFAGFNVTYPVKQAVMPLLDALSDEAEAIGAVNTVVRDGDRLVGHNTDGPGWAWGLARALPGSEPRARGAPRGGRRGRGVRRCADAARHGAPGHRRPRRRAGRSARRTPQRSLSRHPCDDGARCGLGARRRDRAGARDTRGHGQDAGPAVDARLLRPGLWVSEVVYVPLETPLVAAARAAGCTVMDGGHMNVGQAVRAFERFTGLAADPARMDAHFRRLVR